MPRSRVLNQLGLFEGKFDLAGRSAPPSSGCNVWTDKLKCGPFEDSAEQARLKLTTRRLSGASVMQLQLTIVPNNGSSSAATLMSTWLYR
jgi:hypothetical protein